MVITDEIKGLFKKWKSLMGAPVMEVEITDDQLCDLLECAISDFSQITNDYIIESNFMSLYGRDMSKTDIAYALSVRTLDLSREFSYWFSREAGLGQRSNFELKKDSFTIEAGKQDYIIPAGREINRVMWMSPPTTQAAVYAQIGGMVGADFGMAGYGIGAAGGYGNGYLGMPFYFGQAMDVAYMATDLQYKSRMLNGDLWYEVIPGPEGTHIVRLFGNPRRFSFGGWAGLGPGMVSLCGCYVTYTYYDVTPENVDECRRVNPNVVLSPSDVPLETIDFTLLNDSSKNIVRKLFFGLATRALAFTRNKYSGRVSIMDAEAQLDTSQLFAFADKYYDDAVKELQERLARLHPTKLMEQQAQLTESMGKVLSGKPLKMIVV